MLIPKIEAITALLRKQEGQAYQLISEAGEYGISLGRLSLIMFGDRLGLDPSKINCTRVCVCKVRKKLKAIGISIPRANTSGRYRVEVAA